MAYYASSKAVTLPQGEDLRNHFGTLLKYDSDGQVTRATAATDVVIGVLGMAPSVATVGHPVEVVVVGAGGVGKVKAAGAITRGAIIVPGAAGSAGSKANPTALAAGEIGIGIALAAATAAGEIIPVLFQTIAKSA